MAGSMILNEARGFIKCLPKKIRYVVGAAQSYSNLEFYLFL